MSDHGTGRTDNSGDGVKKEPPMVSREGEARAGGDGHMSDHMGAVEDETTPVVPPMDRAPDGEDDDVEMEPRDELTGG